MAARKKKAPAAAASRVYTARIGESRYGFPEPMIEVNLPDARSRALKAAVLQLAALVELASEGEGWIVLTEANYTGRVYLELSTADTAEAVRADRVLARLAEDAERSHRS